MRSKTSNKHIIDFREGGRGTPRHMVTFAGTRIDGRDGSGGASGYADKVKRRMKG